MNTVLIKKNRRVKMNFMFDVNLLDEFKRLIPSGDRSEFMNQALESALRAQKHKAAFVGMKRIRETANLSIQTDELLKLKSYGRK